MPVIAIRSQIASAVDVIVQLNRFPNGARRVTAVTEIVGFDDQEGHIRAEDIFYYDGQDAIYCGYVPTFLPELLEKNYLKLEDIF